MLLQVASRSGDLVSEKQNLAIVYVGHLHIKVFITNHVQKVKALLTFLLLLIQRSN